MAAPQRRGYGSACTHLGMVWAWHAHLDDPSSDGSAILFRRVPPPTSVTLSQSESSFLQHIIQAHEEGEKAAWASGSHGRPHMVQQGR